MQVNKQKNEVECNSRICNRRISFLTFTDSTKKNRLESTIQFHVEMNSNGLDCILQAPAPFSALHTKHSTQNANILEFSSSAFVDRKQQYSLCDHGRNRFCMAQKYPKCSETHPKLSKQKECCVLDRNETSHKNSREIAFTNRLQKLEPHSRKLFHNEHHQ